MTQATEQTQYCVRHPSVETNLRCSRCNELICPRCLVHTPVGARCPDCARLRVNPAFDVSGGIIVRASAGAVAAASIAWLLYFFLISLAGGLGFLLWLIAPLGIGYAVSEAAYRTAGYRRHPRMQWVAGSSVVAGFAVAFLIAAGFLPSGQLIPGLFQAIGRFALGILVAVAMAVYRTRM